MLCCRPSDIEKLKELIANNRINILLPNRFDDGFTGLHLASANGQIEIVKFLLHNGADIDCKTYSGTTALHVAIQHGQYKMAKFLIANGAEVNLTTSKGETALYFAVMTDCDKMVQLLLQNDADPAMGRQTCNKDMTWKEGEQFF